MKYVVYILTAVLAAISVVLLGQFIVMLSATQESNMSITDYSLAFWIRAVSMGAAAVMAAVQLFRSTPRLMLLFAGAAASEGLLLLAGEGVQAISAASQSELTGEGISIIIRIFGASLLMLAAGLLPALYEWIRHERMVKVQPKRTVKRGLLITAAVLACVNLALNLLRLAGIISVIPSEFLIYTLPSYTFGLLFDTGLLITCFMMKRRTGAMYRMFFIGPIMLGAATLPLNLISMVKMGVDLPALAANLILSIVGILAAVFAIAHAAKHRREDFAPPVFTPPYDQPAISAAT
jgi:hypothetical protein